MSNRRITLVRPSQVFDTFMDEFFSNSPLLNQSQAGFSGFEINVQEFGDKIVVDAKVPGFNHEDIDISVEDNMLTIEAKKVQETESEEGNYHVKEYNSGNVRRVISLPTKVDGEAAQAELKNGIMKITLPKLPEVMPKKISIKAA